MSKALEVIEAWDGRDETLPVMLGQVRELAAGFTDTAERALVERELTARTGLRARVLALPRVSGVESVRCKHCGK